MAHAICIDNEMNTESDSFGIGILEQICEESEFTSNQDWGDNLEIGSVSIPLGLSTTIHHMAKSWKVFFL